MLASAEGHLQTKPRGSNSTEGTRGTQTQAGGFRRYLLPAWNKLQDL